MKIETILTLQFLTELFFKNNNMDIDMEKSKILMNGIVQLGIEDLTFKTLSEILNNLNNVNNIYKENKNYYPEESPLNSFMKEYKPEPLNNKRYYPQTLEYRDSKRDEECIKINDINYWKYIGDEINAKCYKPTICINNYY